MSDNSAVFADEYGRELDVHIWGDEETVYVNFRNWPISFTLYLEKDQAAKMIEMLENARRAT